METTKPKALRGIPGATTAQREHLRRARPGELSSAGLPSLIPGADAEPVEVPEHLSEAGKALYVELYWEAPYLDEKDRTAVADLCCLVDDIAACREAIAKHGLLLEEPIVLPTGKVVEGERRLVANPAVSALQAYLRVLAPALTALGLTPASRARLGLDIASLRRRVGV